MTESWYVMVEETISAVYLEELLRPADDTGRGHLMYSARELGWTVDQMRAWIRASDEYALVHAPPPLHPNPLVGGLRYGDRCYADANGPVNPVSLHLGDLIGQGLAFGVQHILPALDLAQQAGFHIVRSWFQNHQEPGMKSYDLFWGSKPTPTWDPRTNVSRFSEILQAGADRGLTWHLAGGGLERVSNTDENALFDCLGDAIGAVGPQYFSLIEALNECRDTGDGDDRTPEELERLVQRVRSRFPQLLYSLSAYTGTEDRAVLAAFTPAWMQHYLYHALRGMTVADYLRHYFSMGYSGESPPVRHRGWSGEPWGVNGPNAPNMVSGMNPPVDGPAMVMGACMAVMARIVPTFMSGPGVIYGCDDLASMPGFFEVPATVRRLPRDLMQFRTLSHSGASKPLRIHAARGNVRADYAIHDDGRYVEVTYGPPNESHELPQVRPTSSVERIYDCQWGHVETGRV